jgi:pimeloyl-ACP methyl ester carboxylesterase
MANKIKIRMHRRIQGLELKVISQSGIFPCMKQPDEFNKILKNF